LKNDDFAKNQLHPRAFADDEASLEKSLNATVVEANDDDSS
jgi:hypothetical protein